MICPTGRTNVLPSIVCCKAAIKHFPVACTAGVLTRRMEHSSTPRWRFGQVQEHLNQAVGEMGVGREKKLGMEGEEWARRLWEGVDLMTMACSRS